MKVCHLATHGCHRTPLGMAGSAMSDRLPLDSVLMRCEKKTDEVCLCENISGSSCGVVGLLSNEELDALESKRVVGGVCAALAVLAGPEEEE